MSAKKRWTVEYSYSDGRKGKVEVTTEISKSGAFSYGNGKAGLLTVGDFAQPYDLRYNRGKSLHMEMIRDYFGKGLVRAIEIP